VEGHPQEFLHTQGVNAEDVGPVVPEFRPEGLPEHAVRAPSSSGAYWRADLSDYTGYWYEYGNRLGRVLEAGFLREQDTSG
jgi:hypothetical protein